MPKIVDPEERRRAVAEAVLRVVARDGLESASLRNVAAEAGLVIGSVRHYFADHTELLIFAMEELGRRIGRRIGARSEPLLALAPGEDGRALTENLFAELLPLDETRHRETVVWLAFTAAARTRPELRPCARRMHDGQRSLAAHVLTEARRAGSLPDGLDIATESLRLSALLDGLALQAVLQPDDVTPEAMRAVLRRHLASLRAPRP
ncbi:TetR/AcrR family transcriptional regulator [Streptomyces sp. I05A-00742]|uniref:TetR/AcrR family transcriptional regulator n=1 Tax=Streptomyces sp. I05A-00742 TaxID=2732853 RepID=UPI001489B839|nr:TetR family transcriptional regulator C-terminal domain-containing protein [Streptomyces sp. I05A-00742]